MVAEQFEKLMLNSKSVLSVILLTDTLVNIPLIILALVFVNAIPLAGPELGENAGYFRTDRLCLRFAAQGSGPGGSVSIFQKRHPNPRGA